MLLTRAVRLCSLTKVVVFQGIKLEVSLPFSILLREMGLFRIFCAL